MSKSAMKLIIAIAIITTFSNYILVECLRCQTQDTENDENFRKIYESCVRRFQNENSDEKNSSDDYESSNEEQRSYSQNNDKNHQQQFNFRMKRQIHGQQRPNWNNNDNNNQNQSRDQSCVFHCIFQKMKMVGI